MLGPEDVKSYIDSRNIDAEVILVTEGHTSDLAANSLDIDLNDVAKTVVFVDEKKHPVLAIVRGSVRIKQNQFAKLVGVSKLRLAATEEVIAMTGFPAGGVCPIGNLCTEKVYMDRELLTRKTLYAGGGTEKYLLKAPPDIIFRESGAILVDMPIQVATRQSER